jgi:DNA-binding NarL/FixJ family response regulator
MDTIKILIVDDHPLMREALRMTFASEEDLEMLAEASSGEEALELLKTIEPDVIMMDLMLPEMSGLEAIEKITEMNPQAKILVNSSMEEEDRILAAVQAGALGYYPKTAPRAYLLEAIRKVADGVPYMPVGITLKLFQGLRKAQTIPSKSDPQKTLTSRQEEVLALVAEGHTDEEISQCLHLSAATVRSHVHHILQRLGLETRAQAVAYAHKREKGE